MEDERIGRRPARRRRLEAGFVFHLRPRALREPGGEVESSLEGLEP